ncbi:hypothetical protein VTL71DRAFT_13584 [Oculimacula yallundae]|uniref:Uncharacterized protein n=1 Tax=Oculimacula yallundae TaxID=86028 RepID=A0ABR4CKW5_9HELO
MPFINGTYVSNGIGESIDEGKIFLVCIIVIPSFYVLCFVLLILFTDIIPAIKSRIRFERAQRARKRDGLPPWPKTYAWSWDTVKEEYEKKREQEEIEMERMAGTGATIGDTMSGRTCV